MRDLVELSHAGEHLEQPPDLGLRQVHQIGEVLRDNVQKPKKKVGYGCFYLKIHFKMVLMDDSVSKQQIIPHSFPKSIATTAFGRATTNQVFSIQNGSLLYPVP